MHTFNSLRHTLRQPLLFISLLGIALMFVLAACGASTTGTSGSAPTATVSGYGSAYGCPSDAVVTTPSSSANITIQPSQANSTVLAHTGDIIEIRLPFNSKWSGPTTSQGILELQTPSGYASKTNSACIWRFVAMGTGTIELNYTRQALCKPGELCPQYIMNVPFTITVK